MAIFFVFMFGVLNFAMHKAVLASGHPLLARMPWFFMSFGGRLSLALEFVTLLVALLLVAEGSLGWAVTYAAYSLLSAVSAWLILTGRV